MPPATFGDLSLPHHDPNTGSVNFRGCVAIAGRLNQTNIPKADLPAVKAHMRAHYEAFGVDIPDSLKAAGDRLVEVKRPMLQRASRALRRLESKTGRVLSAVNEQDIREAVRLLEGVLAQVDQTDAGKELIVDGEPIGEVDDLEDALASISEAQLQRIITRVIVDELMKHTGQVD